MNGILNNHSIISECADEEEDFAFGATSSTRSNSISSQQLREGGGDDDGEDDEDDDNFHDDDEGDVTKKIYNKFVCCCLNWSNETKRVFIWMVMVLGMIGATAAIVLIFTYAFLSNEEQTQFENGFQQQASVIAEATRFQAKTVVGSLEAMSDTITSYTGATLSKEGEHESESSWPFVTIPDFDRRGQRALYDASIEMIAFSPIVTYEDRLQWSNYSNSNSNWLLEGTTTDASSTSSMKATTQTTDTDTDTTTTVVNIPSRIYRIDEDSGDEMEDDNILMVPIWMTSPHPYNTSLLNYNILSDSLYYYLFNAMTESQHTTLSAVYKNDHIHYGVNGPDPHVYLPHSVLMAPVYDGFDQDTRNLAGVIHGTLPWDAYLTDLLHSGVEGIICVLKNSCGQAFTFRIDGPHAEYIGEGDLHDTQYDYMGVEVDFGSDFLGLETRTYRQCFYSLTVYPSEEFQQVYASNETVKFVAVLAGVFAALAVFFFVFVWFVEKRQKKVMGIATRTTAIISGLFPHNVRDRILKQAENQANQEMIRGGSGGKMGTSQEQDSTLRNILKGDGHDSNLTSPSSSMGLMSSTKPGGVTVFHDAPIADLYAACTVIFADLVGFTAWSSTRGPEQVFVLLETLYGAMDLIAKRRNVFKVETVGDCYVAVCGLPKPRRDHAMASVRFAADCLLKGNEVFHFLETTLGPGTSALNVRVGMHSGPVTAGVLRGEKGRFQLFGDTVNTAARMESNGQPGRIHCSKYTADLIKAAGKSQWLEKRSDKIVAKGKGEMITYFVNASEGESSHTYSSATELPIDNLAGDLRSLNTLNPVQNTLSNQHARLVDWMVELLASLLKNIVASRNSVSGAESRRSRKSNNLMKLPNPTTSTPFEEWSQGIDLPPVTTKMNSKDPKMVEIPTNVLAQLRCFVTQIACLHGKNPFHNFDHASHVTMGVHKLLLRVIKSGDDSFRIASDPLTHFAAVLSALIHDVDHKGVNNARLVIEEPELAKKYNNKSVAEQHAIDISWKILTNDRYEELCKTICCNASEQKRFRTVLVNSVLSTDIVNKDLKNLRNERWNLAFSSEEDDENNNNKISPRDVDRYRASSVLEHLIQASDVSHTMQHWHVYRKWNECLFEEMYLAYLDGRADVDPADDWYVSEIGFFDFYIIPLAKKLSEVGVFGESSREYLDFAEKNRAEWEMKGKDVVEEMVAKMKKEREYHA